MRTSTTHPIQICAIKTSVGGEIGLTFCPGKFDPEAMTGAWDRDLGADLQKIKQWGASSLVTLMEDHELALLRVPELGKECRKLEIHWFHLPICDVSIPDETFEKEWHTKGKFLRNRLRKGEKIVVHCRGGLGRTGIIAAKLLIELGETPSSALASVRASRPGAVETTQQERYVLDCREIIRGG